MYHLKNKNFYQLEIQFQTERYAKLRDDEDKYIFFLCIQ